MRKDGEVIKEGYWLLNEYKGETDPEVEQNNPLNEEDVILAGWVQTVRKFGSITFVDLRDRYGITQLIFDEQRTDKAVIEKAKSLGREFVIQIKGTVIERVSKNPNM